MYPIVHLVYGSIVIYNNISRTRGDSNFSNLLVAESDESPIYNIVYSTKIRISIYGREEIRTPGSKKNS